MKTIGINDSSLIQAAYWRAHCALPVAELERPRQYFQRWYETYRCRIRGDYLEFDTESDYVWFMLRWA